MVNADLLYLWPTYVIAFAFLLALFGTIELGYQTGVWRAKKHLDEAGSEFSTIQGAILGLLGLLLAFTYSFAAGRADTRKMMLVNEANAIGTAYLRAELAAEPHRTELKTRLREYLKSRLLSSEVESDPKLLEERLRATIELQNRLWPAVQRMLVDRPPTVVDSLILQSFNDVIDAHTLRMAAGRDRVPDVVIVMMFFVAAVSVGLTGYAGGLAGRRNIFFTSTLACLIVAVTSVIIDLDHPRSGFIRISQAPLVETLESMAE